MLRLKAHSFEKTFLRVVRVGRYFYLMIHILAPPDLAVKSLDEVRADIATKMKGIRLSLIIDTLFTAD